MTQIPRQLFSKRYGLPQVGLELITANIHVHLCTYMYMYMYMYVYVYMALPTEAAQLGKFGSLIVIIQDEQVIALHVQYM